MVSRQRLQLPRTLLLRLIRTRSLVEQRRYRAGQLTHLLLHRRCLCFPAVRSRPATTGAAIQHGRHPVRTRSRTTNHPTLLFPHRRHTTLDTLRKTASAGTTRLPAFTLTPCHQLQKSLLIRHASERIPYLHAPSLTLRPSPTAMSIFHPIMDLHTIKTNCSMTL